MHLACEDDHLLRHEVCRKWCDTEWMGCFLLLARITSRNIGLVRYWKPVEGLMESDSFNDKNEHILVEIQHL
jgi:hypothetical protein